MRTPDTPVFVKTHDFNVWLLNHTRRFPKHFRQTLTQSLEMLALEFEELLIMANAVRGSERVTFLEQADGKLMCLRATTGRTSNRDMAARLILQLSHQ